MNDKIILRLTYFWAFSEVALGGFLHLFHLPFTGIIVGAFSIILNVLLAKYTHFERSTMLKIVGIVLAAKFILNPYSPFGAYVAVAFQGILAIIIFPIFKLNRVSILLFSLLTMIENAVQKPLLAFLFFQKEIIIGLEEISRKSLFFNTLTFQILIGIYFFVYIFWSIIIGNWAFSFSKKLEHFELQNVEVEFDFFQKNTKLKKSKVGFYLFILAMILLVVLLYFLAYDSWSFFFIKIISFSVLLLFIFPFLLKKTQYFFIKNNENTVEKIKNALPEIQKNVNLAYHLSKEKKGLEKIKHFAFLAIWLNVFYEKKEKKIHILSAEIQTGKSAFLLEWVKNKKVKGFLTPTVNGKKMLYDLDKKLFFPFQTDSKTEETIEVGTYFLYKNAFEIADTIIDEAIKNPSDWLIIDEVGKLELRNEGHHYGVLKALQSTDCQLLIVIRDTLLEDVLKKYQIDQYQKI